MSLGTKLPPHEGFLPLRGEGHIDELVPWQANTVTIDLVLVEQYEFVTKWGSRGDGDGQFYGPRDVVVDAAGSVYVADGGNSRIQKFRPVAP